MTKVDSKELHCTYVGGIGRTPQGYTLDEVYNNAEQISTRFPGLKVSPDGATNVYYLFPLRSSSTVSRLLLRLEDKTYDVRDSHHGELYDVDCRGLPAYSEKLGASLVKAVCGMSDVVTADSEPALAAAMNRLYALIPTRLKRGMIFSFTDAVSDNVIRVRPDQAPSENPDEVFVYYAAYPEEYYPYFNAAIEELYSKGFYTEGIYEALSGAVARKNSEMKAEVERQKAEEKRRRLQEKAMKELQRRQAQAELERQRRQQQDEEQARRFAAQEQQGGGLQDAVSEALPPIGSRDTVHYVPAKKLTAAQDKDVTPDSSDHARRSESRGTVSVYPLRQSYYKNPLYVHALISYYTGRSDPRWAGMIWDEVSVSDILEFVELLGNSGALVCCCEPPENHRCRRVYRAVREYLIGDERNASLYYAMLFYCKKNTAEEFCSQAADPQRAMEDLQKYLLTKPDEDMKGSVPKTADPKKPVARLHEMKKSLKKIRK